MEVPNTKRVKLKEKYLSINRTLINSNNKSNRVEGKPIQAQEMEVSNTKRVKLRGNIGIHEDRKSVV